MNFFLRFLATPVVIEEPLDTGVLNKTSTSNILATPAVRRMAKDLQVNK
jgi:hypothetical protein